MPHPCPHHCPPERGGRGLAALAAIIALVIAAAAARPAVRAAETALQVAAITIGAVLALAALGAVAWVAVAVRRHELERRQGLARDDRRPRPHTSSRTGRPRRSSRRGGCTERPFTDSHACQSAARCAHQEPWLAMALSTVSCTRFPLMDSAVYAAYIAAGASVATLAGTMISQRLSSRASSDDNAATLKQQHEQSEKTLKQQHEESEKTLKQQHEQLETTVKAQSEQLHTTLKAQSGQLKQTLAGAAHPDAERTVRHGGQPVRR